MLLHFKLNCFIFVMLVGQINLGEKVSGNIDAFFDSSVDDIQDNFYDIPFIPHNIQEKHDIFQYGHGELIEKINTDLAEIHRLSAIKNEINKRQIPADSKLADEVEDCSQSEPSVSSPADGLLDSVTEKPNEIGKEKSNLHERMRNIEDDEAVLESGGRTFHLRHFKNHANAEKRKILLVNNHRVKRNVFEDFPVQNRRRQHRYVNALHFSHKYRHKGAMKSSFNNKAPEVNFNEAEEAPEVDKRMCNSNKPPRIPHKHKEAHASIHSIKHEAFKAELLDSEGCNFKITADESGCNKTKHGKEHASKTTKEKQKQVAVKLKQNANSLKAKQNTETYNEKEAPKEPAPTPEVAKHRWASSKEQKSSNSPNPPTKASIKSVLCHKHPATTSTTTTSSKFEEYEDYKAGDYIETEKSTTTTKKHKEDDVEFRVKRNKLRRSDVEQKPKIPKGECKNVIEDFLNEETTADSSNSKKFHQLPVLGTKNHKEDAIDKFLQKETTKSEFEEQPPCDYKRNVYHQLEEMDERLKTESADEEPLKKLSKSYDEYDQDVSNEKKDSVSNLDTFINEEIPKTEIFQFPSAAENDGKPIKKHKQVQETDKVQPKKIKDNGFFQSRRTAFLTPIFDSKKVKLKMKERLQNEDVDHKTERMTTEITTAEFCAPEISTYAEVVSNPEEYTRSNIFRTNREPNIFIVNSKNDKTQFDDDPFEETENSTKPNVKLKQRVFIVQSKMKPNQNENSNQNENFERRDKFVVHSNGADSERVGGKNSLKHFEEIASNAENKNKKVQNENLAPTYNSRLKNKETGNHVEFPESEIINYIQEMINNRRTSLMNRNKNKFHHLEDINDNIKDNQFEDAVNIKEMNRKLGSPNENSKLTENVQKLENSGPKTKSKIFESKAKPKIYVAHSKNQGRLHHHIYFEPENPKTKAKTKQKTHSKNDFTRNTHEGSTTTTQLNKYEKFLERLRNKEMFDDVTGEVTTNKIKHQTEIDTEADTIDETPETFPEGAAAATDEDNPETIELYSEIPVNKKRIQLSLNCDSADYANKDHCICSVQTMLRDLVDDLKDINSTVNYQYDCTKYIGIQPGVVIANDSRRLLVKRDVKQDVFFTNFLLRKGLRIGRDVDSLLNDNLNIDTLDGLIYATVGSKVVLNCGNSSDDYNDEDKIVWTVHHGAPETAGFKEDNGRELVIERVSAQDTNNYTCAISHKLEDGNFSPAKKFLHKLSIVELPIYSIMITVVLNESAKCEHEDLDTLHHFYPILLNQLLCHGADQICSVSVDKPHCTKSHSENGITVHATLKTAPLYTILPTLRKKQQKCGISCQSRIYSIIVKTLRNNFASVANLPGITGSKRNSYPYSSNWGTSRICSPIRF